MISDFLYGFFRLFALACVVVGVHLWMAEEYEGAYIVGGVVLAIGVGSLVLSFVVRSKFSECFVKIQTPLKHPLYIFFMVSYGAVVIELFRFVSLESFAFVLLPYSATVCVVSGGVLLRLCIKAAH